MSTFHTAASHPVARGEVGSSTHQIVRYGDSGVGTVEGNVAGARAARLTKARESEQKEYDNQRKNIESEQRADAVKKVDEKFVTYSDAYEADFRKRTVGLVTAAQFRERRHHVERNEETCNKHDTKELAKKQLAKKRKKKRAKQMELLSFSADADGDEGEDVDGLAASVGAPSQTSSTKVESLSSRSTSLSAGVGGASGDKDLPARKKPKLSVKDPSVDTSFLPDRDREASAAREREMLKQRWRDQQKYVRAESIEVTYSYWDGSGHRRNITVPKGTLIGKFLELVRQNLCAEFPEMRGVSADNLLYVKEDLIIPQHFSFYDLIVTKARGKSGPLFHFDVHEDVRLAGDARVEKDESHPGKICERSWYERNKHIFPASRWEVYDPAVVRERYTIHGDEVQLQDKR
eukprot:g1162.t1